MSQTSQLSIAPKLSLGLEYAVEVCVCKDKNKENGVKSIILINLEEGEFLKDEKEQWHFKSTSGHQWEINKVPEKFREGEEVTESDKGVINSATSFSENFTDELCRERIWLKKRYFVSGQQYITVRVTDSSKDPANE